MFGIYQSESNINQIEQFSTGNYQDELDRLEKEKTDVSE